jgi:hypothetical protein
MQETMEDRAMRRQRIKHKATFEERLAAEAQRLKNRARTMAVGKAREELLDKARQAETASHISDWLRSSTLPK